MREQVKSILSSFVLTHPQVADLQSSVDNAKTDAEVLRALRTLLVRVTGVKALDVDPNQLPLINL